MSVISCTESEYLDEILDDYNKKVTSRKEYYFWANQKYQWLTSLLKNPKNSQIVYKALNFITYLDSQSGVDKKLKDEKRWNEFFDWERIAMKDILIEEFDPIEEEKKLIIKKLITKEV